MANELIWVIIVAMHFMALIILIEELKKND